MISQRKIAEKLGMPTSTVANILNGTPYYKKETRERVLKAAAELGYQRNRASIAIRRGRSNLIGVIHFGSSYETANRGIYFLVEALREHGYDYIVVDQRWHAGNVQGMLNEMIQARVEGVILIGNGSGEEAFSPASLATFERAGIPVVSLFGDDYLDLPLVGDNAKASFHAMASHLQSVGHRRILLPSSPSNERSTLGRIEGLEQAMKGRGQFLVFDEEGFFRKWPKVLKERRDGALGIVVRLNARTIYSQEDFIKFYGDFSRRLFALSELPDAIMCANDRAACSVFDAAYEAGLRIPQDVAVVGADDDAVGKLSMLRLTTIRMDIARSSKATVEMLMERLKTGRVEKREVAFPAELVLRQSCGRLMTPDGERELVVRLSVPQETP
jgi:LacI family transcriptional regulator